MNLLQALRVKRDARMAFVGAGGKTTAINLLAGELAPPVFVTTSTHMSRSQLLVKHLHIEYQGPSTLSTLMSIKDEVIYITGKIIDKGGRSAGMDEASISEISILASDNLIPLLIEADGSRSLPLKAPSVHEPNIPKYANHVVVVTGLSCLGESLNNKNAHRVEEILRITGASIGQPIDTDLLSKILRHPNGGLKNIPKGARKTVLLNQADKPDIISQGEILANNLLGPYDSIIIASLAPGGFIGEFEANSECIHRVFEPTAGVVLAAGESSRFGSPKLLNHWKGIPIIRHVALSAVKSGLSPIIVVLGAVQGPIINVIGDLPVSFVINKDWQEGQSTSLRSGVNGLPQTTGSAIFLLADQPQIPVELIMTLKQEHEKSLAKLIIPRVREKRANPVLFDRDAFEDLNKVTGDQGGRAVFEKYPITWLEWKDEKILLDIDTPDDYQKLLQVG